MNLNASPEDTRRLLQILLLGPAPRDGLLNLRRILEVAPDLSLPSRGKSLRALAALLSSGPEIARLVSRKTGPPSTCFRWDVQLDRSGKDDLDLDSEEPRYRD